MSAHRTASLLVLLLLGQRARAEDAAAGTSPDDRSAFSASTAPARTPYGTVVRGRSRPVGARDDPAAFSTRIRLGHRMPGERLSDVLRQVPGAQLRDYGPGQAQTFAIRAAEAHQVAVVLDDIRLADPGRGSVDLSLIDPHHLRDLEVRRSGGSARFGSGALGGTLLLRTRRTSSRPRSSVGLGYGAWNTLAARLAHADRAGRLRYLASATYRQTDGDFIFVNHNQQTARRVNNQSRRGEALLKLDRTIGDKWQVGLLDHFGAAFRGAPGPSMNQSATAEQHDVRNLTALRAKRVGLLAAGGHASFGLFHRYSRFRFAEPTRSTESSANRFRLGTSAALSLPLQPRFELDGRLELAQQWLFDDRVGDRRRFSAELSSSARWGLLAEHLALVPAGSLLAATGFEPTFMPKLGIVVRPLAHLPDHPLATFELLANAGRSYRFPSFQELYLRVDGFQPNPELAPEDAWSIDAGVRWRWAETLTVEAAFFYRWLDNTILYAPSGSFIVKPDNYSEARVHGLESALEIVPGLGLAARLAYTLTRTRFLPLSDPTDGSSRGALALPGHPAHRLTARLQWSASRCTASVGRRGNAPPNHAGPTTEASQRRVGIWRWLAGLTLHVEARAQSDMVLDRFNSETLAEEGRILLSAAAAYAYRGLTFDVRLHNLLDKRDAVDTLGFPLAPRSFFLSSSAQW